MAAPATRLWGGGKTKILGHVLFYTRKRPFTNMERRLYLKGMPMTNFWLRKGSLKIKGLHHKKYFAHAYFKAHAMLAKRSSETGVLSVKLLLNFILLFSYYISSFRF